MLDNRQMFKEYAQYVLELKERNGIKHRTLERYKEMLIRINEAIGHMKLVDINPHAFRHTVASVLLANGLDIVTVSKQLGHANVGNTENFYSHIIEQNKAKASECIADVLLRRKA